MALRHVFVAARMALLTAIVWLGSTVNSRGEELGPPLPPLPDETPAPTPPNQTTQPKETPVAVKPAPVPEVPKAAEPIASVPIPVEPAPKPADPPVAKVDEPKPAPIPVEAPPPVPVKTVETPAPKGEELSPEKIAARLLDENPTETPKKDPAVGKQSEVSKTKINQAEKLLNQSHPDEAAPKAEVTPEPVPETKTPEPVVKVKPKSKQPKRKPLPLEEGTGAETTGVMIDPVKPVEVKVEPKAEAKVDAPPIEPAPLAETKTPEPAKVPEAVKVPETAKLPIPSDPPFPPLVDGLPTPASIAPPTPGEAQNPAPTPEPPALTKVKPTIISDEKPEAPAPPPQVEAPPAPVEQPENMDEVKLAADAEVYERSKVATFTLNGPKKFMSSAFGMYSLRDLAGREVARGTFKTSTLEESGDGGRKFTVPLERALGVGHTLTLGLIKGDDTRVERTLPIRIKKDPDAWSHWMSVVLSRSATDLDEAGWSQFQNLGIRGGMAMRMKLEQKNSYRNTCVPFYVENVAGRFLSRYHAVPDLWEKTIKEFLDHGESPESLSRKPSLLSLRFQQEYAAELRKYAEFYRDEHPLFYSLAAEPSMTRLSAAFDFDFDPEALKEFRLWLKRDAYGTLDALNSAWDTHYKTWDEVAPATTGDTLANWEGGSRNLSKWADFRAFMDLTFAKTLEDGAQGLRLHDAQAKVGITGAMGPFAFGGWDWSLLSKSLDVVECYDVGGARALWRDLAPGKPAFAQIQLASEPNEIRSTLWNMALDGGPRGALLWDYDFASKERVLLNAQNAPTPTAVALMPTLQALDGPVGKTLANAKREPAKVALLYSPSSVRVKWLIEAYNLHNQTPTSWLQAWGQKTSLERIESPQLKLRVSWMKLLSDLGLPWRFVSTEELEKGVLTAADSSFQAIVLPQALSLSDLEAAQLNRFASQGGTVIADACAGRFDTHGHARTRSLLDPLFGVNTSNEPFWPEPRSPLKNIEELGVIDNDPLLPQKMDFARLPDCYSDKLFWMGPPPARRCEYKQCPSLVRRGIGKGGAVYLNMNLEEYYKWRQDPGLRQRAQTLRTVLSKIAFKTVLDGLKEDLSASNLPEGTEIVRLTAGTGADAISILALRRNPLERAHELFPGGPKSFDAAESFKLTLRTPTWTASMLDDKAPAQSAVLQGKLDPYTPTIFILRNKKMAAPALTAQPGVAQGGKIVLNIQPGPGADAGPRAYGVRVLMPNQSIHPSYGGSYWSPDGTCSVEIPLAYNDLVGSWTLLVRDATTGLDSRVAITVNLAP